MDFKRNRTYKFGILSEDGERNPAAPYPSFKKTPKPVAIAGSLLIDGGMKTFGDYLERNPHNFPPKDIVQCYELDNDSASFIKLNEGNPFKRESERPQQSKALSDRAFSNPPAQSAGMRNLGNEYMPIPRSRIDLDGLQKIFQDQIDKLNETLREKEIQISALTNKHIELISKNGQLEAELRSLEMENDKLNNSLETLLNREKESAGLADGGVGMQIASLVTELATDPNVRSGVVNFIKSKFGGGQQQQTGQQQPLPSFDEINSAGTGNSNGSSNVTTNQ